jgi:uncharacterized membrane protein
MMQTTARPWLIRHWLLLANLTAWTFALLPVLAPVLMALGLIGLADPIYSAYTLVCHQWAHRSFFLFGPQVTYSLSDIGYITQGSTDLAYIGSAQTGYKVAFCERDLAIYLSIALAGSMYAIQRANSVSLAARGYVLALLPIAIDGFTQLFGWRESTPALRVMTGGCFGLSTVWFIFPRLDIILNRSMPVRPVTWTRAVS